MKALKQKIDVASSGSKNHLYQFKAIYLISVLLLLVCGGVYIWQHSKVTDKSVQISKLNGQVQGLNDKVRALNTETKKLNDTLNSLQQSPQTNSKKQSPTATLPIDYSDSNFVLLSPNCGLLTHQNATVFEWAPHKLATTYAVQIKFIGQQTYPTVTPADQIITSDASSQLTRITLKKDLPFGDYTWRVTAKATINGQETVLQSTPDCNYQTWAP